MDDLIHRKFRATINVTSGAALPTRASSRLSEPLIIGNGRLLWL